MILLTIAIVLLMCTNVPLALEYTFHANTTRCQNFTATIVDASSRSDCYSILNNITSQDLSCAEPLLDLSLNGRNSMIAIYQTLCQNIESQHFNVNYQFVDLPSSESPTPVFDENFSPQNYFLDGEIQLKIINTTTILSSVNIDLCLFSGDYEYNRFLRAGANWKNYTKNSYCNTITVEDGENYLVSFHINKPMFAFLGMASVGAVQISHLNVTATGRQISDLGRNSTKACELTGEDTTCNFNLELLNNENISLCIVAYEQGNADGTYDYSNLTVSFPNRIKHNNPYKKTLIVYGSTSLGIILISVLLLIGIILAAILRKRSHDRQNSPKEYLVQSKYHAVEDTRGKSLQSL